VLSALNEIDIDATPNGSFNFANILDYIFSKVQRVDNFYFPGADAVPWLKKEINWDLFKEVDSDGTVTPKYTCGELLEEICKFFGWTCRVSGRNVFFTSADDALTPAYTVLDAQELYDLGQTGTTTYSTAGWQQVNISGNVYADDENEELYLTGVRKATVNADIARFDTVMELDLEKLNDILEGNNILVEHTGTDDKHLFVRRNGYANSVETEQNERTISYIFGDAKVSMLIDTDAQPWVYQSTVFQYATYEGSLNDLHNIDWESVLRVYANSNPTNRAWTVIESLHPRCFDHGVLVISADTQALVNKQIYNGSGTLTCRLQVGDKYWDGSSWGDNSNATFTFPIGELGGWDVGVGKIMSNRTLNQTTWTSPYPNYNGYGVPIDDTMYGYVKLEIVTISSGAPAEDMPVNNRFVDLKNIEVSFLRAVAYAPYADNDRNVYTGSPINTIGSDKTVDTIFASDLGNSAGMGIILNANEQGYCSELNYTYGTIGGPEHPEQHLADRMAAFGSRRRQCVTMNFIKSAVQAITPRTKVFINNKTYYPISISQKYRDDVLTVKMIEL
jgi:hypothetical protein